MASKSEQNTIFEVLDIKVSTVCTTDSENTADSAPSYGETEWTGMSLDSESDQEIESHLIYKEEHDRTYMIPVRNKAARRKKEQAYLIDTSDEEDDKFSWKQIGNSASSKY